MEERWAWFLQHYTKRMEQALYCEAYRLLHNKEDVADVIQEVIIKGAVNCWQLSDEDKLFQWMFTILRREVYAYQSKRSLKTLWSSLKLAVGILDSCESLEYQFISKEDMNRLQNEIKHLESPEKDVIMLKATTDMSLLEISHQLKLNYNTVRSLYRRTLATLKQRLEDDGNEKNRSTKNRSQGTSSRV